MSQTKLVFCFARAVAAYDTQLDMYFGGIVNLGDFGGPKLRGSPHRLTIGGNKKKVIPKKPTPKAPGIYNPPNVIGGQKQEDRRNPKVQTQNGSEQIYNPPNVPENKIETTGSQIYNPPNDPKNIPQNGHSPSGPETTTGKPNIYAPPVQLSQIKMTDAERGELEDLKKRRDRDAERACLEDMGIFDIDEQ